MQTLIFTTCFVDRSIRYGGVTENHTIKTHSKLTKNEITQWESPRLVLMFSWIRGHIYVALQ
jgi:hypothetical protein